MSKVVEFPQRPPPMVLVCSNPDCGSQSFWLYADGRVECLLCNEFQTELASRWLQIVPNRSDLPLGDILKLQRKGDPP